MNAPRVNHPTPADLAAFAVGKLSEADAGAVAEHLEHCPACRNVAESAPPDSFVARVKEARPASAPKGGTQVPGAAAAPLVLPPELAQHPRYRILRELGRGGMGVVYQARQTVMDRPVVIKVINKALLDRPDAVERFRREVKAAARLAHPNIVTAYDAEQAGDLHMLVMEFVPGRSRAEVLQQKGSLSVAQACDCVRQAALGLQHAADQGMVHRDIKPQNLMLTPQGQVKILDFGLAKLASEAADGKGLTADNAYMGTPDYSAPEQATDARTADIRADIYSLGCTLYCLLAGRPPFQEDTAMQTLLAHLQKEPVPLPELRRDMPARLWDVVARLLAKDPAARPQTPAEVAEALVPFCRESARPTAPVASPPGVASPGRTTVANAETSPLPAAAPAAPAAAVAGRSATRWPWLLGGAAVALLGLGLGAWLLAGVVFKARTPQGTLVLEVSAPDAEVLVDGKRWEVHVAGEREPIRIELAEGPHQLKVTRGGFEAFSEEVTITAGKAEHVTARLVPREAPAGKRDPGFTPLFNGKDLTGWSTTGGLPAQWKVQDGALEVVPGAGHLMTTKAFGPDLRLRAEFLIPPQPDKHGQARGNSGIFFLGRHEIQIVDDVDNDVGPAQEACGALFGVIGPSRHVTRPPGQWQEFDIEYHAPRYAHSKPARPGRLTVVFNGVKVIDAAPFAVASTTKAPYGTPATLGPIILQERGCPVRFRRLDIQELPPPPDDTPAAPAAPAADAPFVPLFNGRDLTGWSVESGDHNHWSTPPGEIVARCADAHRVNWLLTDREYGDFVLRLEFRLEDGASSGVALRAFPGEWTTHRWGKEPVHPVIKLTDPVRFPSEPPGTTEWLKDRSTRVKPVQPAILRDGWNTLEAEMRGETLRASINGKVVVDVKLNPVGEAGTILPGLARRRGRIGLQAQVGVAHYRNVEIKELPAAGD
jgi:tRNA A-37 threonylcarbamoyl transferase component Bud32